MAYEHPEFFPDSPTPSFSEKLSELHVAINQLDWYVVEITRIKSTCAALGESPDTDEHRCQLKFINWYRPLEDKWFSIRDSHLINALCTEQNQLEVALSEQIEKVRQLTDKLHALRFEV